MSKQDARRIDIAGQRFGMLVAVRDIGRRRSYRLWHCACDCGASSEVPSGNLLGGHTTSCGCVKRSNLGERTRTHGMRQSTTYAVWCGMKQRCFVVHSTYYHRYGGRGITVCDRWRDSFEAFLADVGERPPGLSLDRINNDGNYEPGNVRWATRSEQNRNTSANRWVAALGAYRTLAEWEEVSGVPEGAIRRRLAAGWSPDEAVSRPPRAIRRRASGAGAGGGG